MIIKEQNGSTPQSGTVFQNGFRVEPFWLHFLLTDKLNPGFLHTTIISHVYIPLDKHSEY